MPPLIGSPGAVQICFGLFRSAAHRAPEKKGEAHVCTSPNDLMLFFPLKDPPLIKDVLFVVTSVRLQQLPVPRSGPAAVHCVFTHPQI